jgi:hypothetical protein
MTKRRTQRTACQHTECPATGRRPRRSGQDLGHFIKASTNHGSFLRSELTCQCSLVARHPSSERSQVRFAEAFVHAGVLRSRPREAMEARRQDGAELPTSIVVQADTPEWVRTLGAIAATAHDKYEPCGRHPTACGACNRGASPPGAR